MDNTYSGYLEINDIVYSFFLNGTNLSLVRNSERDNSMIPFMTYKYDYLYGQLTSLNYICLLDVIIEVGLLGDVIGSVSAIIKGTRNMGDDISIEPIDSIRFMGKLINNFFSSHRIIDIDKTVQSRTNGNPAIFFKHQSEIKREHRFGFKTNAAKLLLNAWYSFQLDNKSDVVATVNSYLEIILDNSIKCKYIKDIYNQVLGFFRFINFRRNINFDKILLGKLNTKNQFEGVAEFILLSNEENANGGIYSTIIYDDLCERITELFEIINTSYRYTLFIPKNDREARIVDILSYINTSASFEYFYSKYFANPMDEKLIDKSKQEVINNLQNISSENLNELIDYIQKFDNTKTLKNKFKEVLSSKKEIITRVFPDLNLNSNGVNEIAFDFSRQRNKIAHGDTDELMGLKINPYVITLCLLYIMILEESSIDSNTIVNILKKIFGNYYINK